MDTAAAINHVIDLRRRALQPVADNQRMELAAEAALTTPPLVLILGNHSSGKSSLINHLLGSQVQRTGVAPTDDCFTVLMHGDHERSLDGSSLTTNPDLPFNELTRFGPGLTEHLRGRELASDLLRHVRIIDSPGMIDAASNAAERPYDFAAVVRWFAEQADLILLLFDPEK
ncbi:MAG: dynamin family protein, partial [Planctomycetota bacterium]